MNDTTVIETVTFHALPDANEAELISALRGIDDFLEGRDGFLRRHLSRDEDGQWLEHVVWENMAKAQAAAADFPKSKEGQAAMAFIDGPTAKVRHETLIAYKAA